MATQLKLKRIERNIPQWKLAGILEISQAELSRYELGRRRVNADLRRRIAKELDYPVDVVFPEIEAEQEAERLRTNGDVW